MRNVFNVGDIVRAREITDDLYRITCKKNSFVGKVISVRGETYDMTLKTLESKDKENIGVEFYMLPNNDRYFEKVNEKKKVKEVKPANQGIEITIKEVGDGKTTMAILSKGGRVVKTAFAYCNPEDEYNAEIGCTVAFARLLGIDTDKII